MNHARMDARTLTEVLLQRGLSILPLAGPRGPASSPSPSITLLYIFLHITNYSHNLFGKGKIGTRISTRSVIDTLSLIKADFGVRDILDHAILSQYEQDSSTIVNDANILREYADSIGVYNSRNNN